MSQDEDRTVLRPRAAVPAPPPPAVQALPGNGLNPLVQAATSLLLLAAHVRDMFQPPDIETLRAEATRALREFEARTRQLGIANDLMLTARYLLCTMLDEAVLDTPWGQRSQWGAQTLLMAFHRESWGGEKFFQVLDRASADPARYADLLELLYVCLSLGFTGKYRVVDDGNAKLAEVRHALYQRIRAVRGGAEAALSPHWQGVGDRRPRLARYLPLWVAAAAAAFALCAVFAFYYVRLAAQAEPIAAGLAGVGMEALDVPPPAAPPAPPDTPTLKRLLAAEETAGRLDVSEYGDRSVVSLHGLQFASGSAQPAPDLGTTLKAVALAVDTYARSRPGRILVQGHTDDAPLRSFKYANNHELSAERAKEVARLLKATLAPAVGVEAIGRGADQPRCTPPGTRDNRACNRRVEIVYFFSSASGDARAQAP
ncbi:MAG: type IVB secretion system protein IcmH/DotU [Solimonas sp.]